MQPPTTAPLQPFGTHHAAIFWICRLRVRCLGAAAAAAEEPLDASFEGPSPNTLTLPPSLVAGRGKGGGRGGGGEAVEAGTSPTSPITLSHDQWTAVDAAVSRVVAKAAARAVARAALRTAQPQPPR
jgi:hypothetical protein